MLEDGVVEMVLSVKKAEVGTAVGFLEIRLAVDEFIVLAKESPYDFLFLRSDATEGGFLQFLELSNHSLINHKVCGSVLSLVEELLATHSAEEQGSCHVEGGIDQDARDSIDPFSIHCSHGGAYDDVGLLFGNELR